MKNDAMILFFVKYPEPGEVKTRLAGSIGWVGAAGVYRNFVLDLLEKLESTGLSFKICFHPERKREQLIGWLGAEYDYSPQSGAHLGERMSEAFQAAFAAGHRWVILIGSDFPDLPESFFHEALNALKTHDSVIGPALDGGYYLIGFRSEAFFAEAFEGIDWGKESVFRKTLSILKDHNNRVYILPVWNDIDSLEELKQFRHRGEGTKFSTSRTMKFLSRLKIP